jgi:hypothetical protein
MPAGPVMPPDGTCAAGEDAVLGLPGRAACPMPPPFRGSAGTEPGGPALRKIA